MILPSPLDYLKSNAIAFAAGALAVLALQLYGKVAANRRSSHS